MAITQLWRYICSQLQRAWQHICFVLSLCLLPPWQM